LLSNVTASDNTIAVLLLTSSGDRALFTGTGAALDVARQRIGGEGPANRNVA
jgi:hypothetical protein